MTTARMMTSLGAVALGLAMAGAVPALAATGSAANQTGGAAGMSAAQTNSTGGSNGAMSNGATTGAGMNGTTGAMQTGQANTGTTGNATGTTTGTTAGTNTGTTTGNEGSNATAGQAPAHPMTRTGMSNEHHATHRMHTASRRGALNPNAQNADVARLNEQSLQAAQQGRNFTPPGAHGSM